MHLFYIVLIFFNISLLIKAQATLGVNNVDQSEDMDAVTNTALLTKINWLMQELVKENVTMDDLKNRLATQENLMKTAQRTRNGCKVEIRDMKAEIRDERLKKQYMFGDMQENQMKGFENLQKPYRTTVQPQLKNINSQSNHRQPPKQTRNWSVILRRQDGSEDFYRTWNDYKKGFGNTNGEFFIGLEKLHAITTYGDRQELLIILEDFDNQTRYARYDDFAVGSESEKYKLARLGQYSGDAGDSLRLHVNAMFSTQDQDNDSWHLHCAQIFKGAWWFVKCFDSHLNGPYMSQSTSEDPSKRGIIWKTFHGAKYSLKFVEMLIRPKI